MSGRVWRGLAEEKAYRTMSRPIRFAGAGAAGWNGSAGVNRFAAGAGESSATGRAFLLLLSLTLVISFGFLPLPRAVAATVTPSEKNSAPISQSQPGLTPVLERERLQAQIIDLAPRVWQQNLDTDLTVTVLLKNQSQSFVRTPGLQLQLTKKPLDTAANWKNWVSGSPKESTTTVKYVVLPSMFAKSQATVKITLPQRLIKRLTSETGVYGLRANLKVVSLSNVSSSAKTARQKVNHFLSSPEGKGKPPRELGVRGKSFIFQPQLPLDLTVHPDSKYVGDIYRVQANTLLPVLSEEPKTVPVTVFSRLELTKADLSTPIPAVTAADHTKAVIEATKQAGFNLVIDPALLDYVPTTIASPENILPAPDWDVEQILNPTDNDVIKRNRKSESTPAGASKGTSEGQRNPNAKAASDTTEPPQNPTGPPQSNNQNPADKSAPAAPSAEGTPEADTVQADQRRLLMAVHSLSELNTAHVALLPWGNPRPETFTQSGVQAKLLASRAFTRQSEWADLLKKAKEVKGAGKPVAKPSQLLWLNTPSEQLENNSNLNGFLANSGAHRELLLSSREVAKEAPNAVEKWSGKTPEPVTTLIEDTDASQFLAAALALDPDTDFNAAQMLLASMSDSAVRGQKLLLSVPADAPSIINAGNLFKQIQETQGWVSTQNLHQMLNGTPEEELKPTDLRPAPSPDSVDAENRLKPLPMQTYGLISSNMERLSRVAAILNDRSLLLDPAMDSLLLITGKNADADPQISAWVSALEAWWEPLQVNPPESVLMIYGESALPVSVKNQLPWPVTVDLVANSASPRLRSKQPTKATIPADSDKSVDLKLVGVGYGDVKSDVYLLSSAGVQVSPQASLLVRIRADWENRGLLLIGAAALAVFLFGLIRRIRKGRRVKVEDLKNVEPFHNV